MTASWKDRPDVAGFWVIHDIGPDTYDVAEYSERLIAYLKERAILGCVMHEYYGPILPRNEKG